MRTIKTIADLRYLQHATAFPYSFLSYLEEEFRGLKEAFDFDGLEEDFTLDMYGFMVVLEKGDNLRDLSVVGLHRENSGLLGSLPEFVEKIELESTLWYKVVVIYTNEYGMVFYVPNEAVADDEEIQKWLEENTNVTS